MHTEPLLRIENVGLRFGGLTALEGVSFDVQENKIYGLIGPNGAGKSSLFNCITRLYDPTTGAIYFKGGALLAQRANQVASWGIARTFQDLSLFRGMTVRQNIAMGAHHRIRASVGQILLGFRSYKNQENSVGIEMEEIIDALSLHDVQDLEVNDLPYGTMKRVELARVLLAKPTLLLLDEPASGLTQTEVHALAELIVQMKERYNLTILLVEHHMGMVMKICDQIVVLNLGKNIAEGNPQAIQANPEVARAYLGE